jgi:hypothetical protein
MYFVEVKYRRTNRQGSGLEYVTAKKLEQMRFAASSWVHAQQLARRVSTLRCRSLRRRFPRHQRCRRSRLALLCNFLPNF